MGIAGEMDGGIEGGINRGIDGGIYVWRDSRRVREA
jgi:hypothetical protein